MNKLQVKNKTITNPSEILEEQKCFYQNLYKSKLDSNEEHNDEELKRIFFREDQTIPKLTEEEQNKSEGEITEGELLDVLKSCENNKSPGSDGFPVEFYKQFSSAIKQYYNS